MRSSEGHVALSLTKGLKFFPSGWLRAPLVPLQVLLPVHRLCLTSLLGGVQLTQQFLHCAGGPGIGLNVLMHDVVQVLVAIDAGGGGIQDSAFTLSLYSWLEDEPTGMPARGNGRKSGYSISPVDIAEKAGAPASPEVMPILTLIF